MMGNAQTSLALTSARSNDATKSFSTANDQQGRPVVSFSKQAELKIIKDQGQPSLFCRGGGTQAYAITVWVAMIHKIILCLTSTKMQNYQKKKLRMLRLPITVL